MAGCLEAWVSGPLEWDAGMQWQCARRDTGHCGGKGETSISDKLHDDSDHVLIRKESQQLAGKATVPESVISSCQVDK